MADTPRTAVNILTWLSQASPDDGRPQQLLAELVRGGTLDETVAKEATRTVLDRAATLDPAFAAWAARHRDAGVRAAYFSRADADPDLVLQALGDRSAAVRVALFSHRSLLDADQIRTLTLPMTHTVAAEIVAWPDPSLPRDVVLAAFARYAPAAGKPLPPATLKRACDAAAGEAFARDLAASPDIHSLVRLAAIDVLTGDDLTDAVGWLPQLPPYATAAGPETPDAQIRKLLRNARVRRAANQDTADAVRALARTHRHLVPVDTRERWDTDFPPALGTFEDGDIPISRFEVAASGSELRDLWAATGAAHRTPTLAAAVLTLPGCDTALRNLLAEWEPTDVDVTADVRPARVPAWVFADRVAYLRLVTRLQHTPNGGAADLVRDERVEDGVDRATRAVWLADHLTGTGNAVLARLWVTLLQLPDAPGHLLDAAPWRYVQRALANKDLAPVLARGLTDRLADLARSATGPSWTDLVGLVLNDDEPTGPALTAAAAAVS